MVAYGALHVAFYEKVLDLHGCFVTPSVIYILLPIMIDHKKDTKAPLYRLY